MQARSRTLSAGFNDGLICLFSGPCIGDTFSSSPSSTPMGSMESLSSHSSEQNNSIKTAVSAQGKDRSALHQSPLEVSNGPRGTVCISSPESSSREDAGRTDVESEDALSVSSLSNTPRLSPAPQKAPHCRTDLKPALMFRSDAPSLKSLHISEGNHQVSFILNYTLF